MIRKWLLTFDILYECPGFTHYRPDFFNLVGLVSSTWPAQVVKNILKNNRSNEVEEVMGILFHDEDILGCATSDTCWFIVLALKN